MSLSDGFLTFYFNVLIENESKKVELKVSDFSISALFSVFLRFLLCEKNRCTGTDKDASTLCSTKYTHWSKNKQLCLIISLFSTHEIWKKVSHWLYVNAHAN